MQNLVLPHYLSFSLVMTEVHYPILPPDNHFFRQGRRERFLRSPSDNDDESDVDVVMRTADRRSEEELDSPHRPSLTLSIVTEEDGGATVAEAVDAIIRPIPATQVGSPATLVIPRSKIGAVVKALKMFILERSLQLRLVSMQASSVNRPRPTLKRSFSLP